MTDLRIHPSILRAYDIRGVAGETISEPLFAALGRAFGAMVRERVGAEAPRIAVARDGRVSSPGLHAALLEGLVAAGIQVSDYGLGPTPMCYFAAHHGGYDAAMMVTGSHNPAEHNGIKMTINHYPFYGEDIQLLGKRALEPMAEVAPGKVEEKSIRETYVASLCEVLGAPKKALKVAWDPGNGAAGELVEMLVKRLPGEHVVINSTIDGRFPNHHPDPTVEENLQQLKDVVHEHGCDLGIAFDGDADRIGAVDGQGRVVWGDQLLTLYARDIVSKNPGQTIIADVKASQHFFDAVAEMGGKPLMWKTGHSLIKAKMKETKAPLAGEMSGHIFFADTYYGFDDALYAAMRLLRILSQQEASLADELEAMPRSFTTPEVRIDVDDARKFVVIHAMVEAVKSQPGVEVNETDGVRVRSDHGWWLVRASNTQAAITLRMEADTQAKLAVMGSEVAALLDAHGVDSAPWRAVC